MANVSTKIHTDRASSSQAVGSETGTPLLVARYIEGVCLIDVTVVAAGGQLTIEPVTGHDATGIYPMLQPQSYDKVGKYYLPFRYFSAWVTTKRTVVGAAVTYSVVNTFKN